MAADQRKTKSELIAELSKHRRQANRAKKLNQNLKDLQADYRALEARCGGDYSFIEREKGMFSFLGLRPDQAQRLREEVRA